MDLCCQNQYHYTQTGHKVKKKNEHTPAIAWASNVLPHPGGPWRRNPLGGVTPSARNTSGCFMWTSSLQTWSTVSSQPPMSENFTDDWVSSNSWGKKIIKIWFVVLTQQRRVSLQHLSQAFPLNHNVVILKLEEVLNYSLIFH